MDFRKTVQQLSKTDPALKQASEQVQKHLQLTVDLILEKALAYQDKPKQHPLPADPTAPEAALAQLLDSCGLLRRRKIRKGV